MTNQEFIQNIRNLIAKDDLTMAIVGLKVLLDNTPLLNEILHQSGRFENIRKQIRLGTVSYSEANLTQNQIRAGLLELVSEMEQQDKTPTIRTEIEHAVSMVNSKNILVNSPITAGGDVHIGDKTIHTESETSKRLRLFLLLFVPLLALGIAYLWYRLQPVTLTVAIQYQAANPDLAFEKGEIILHPGGKPKEITNEKEAIFTDIRRGERVSLHFAAEGFVPIDTVFVPEGNQNIVLPIQHDDSRAILSGIILDEDTRHPIEGVRVSIPCCETLTNAYGKFEFSIPPLYQHREQMLKIDREEYESKHIISLVKKGESAQINLRKLH